MSDLAHLMPDVIEQLRKGQDYYDILSDEEYVESEYFNNPNRKNYGKQVWIHCVDPETGVSTVEIYFKNIEIAIPLSKKDIRDFQTSIDVERKIMKSGLKNEYISLRLRRDGEIQLVEDTVALAMELFKFARGQA